MNDHDAATDFTDTEFNAGARVVFIIVAVLAAIHGLRALLSPETDFSVISNFAFVPARLSLLFDADSVRTALRDLALTQPSEAAALDRLLTTTPFHLWTIFTYALLHGDWAHVLVNALWLVAFGVAVARRFSTQRFCLLLAAAALGGTALHYATHSDDFSPLIGASASVAGAMGAAIRFAFSPGAPLGGQRTFARDLGAYRLPAQSLGELLREPRVLMFLAIWMVTNFVFGALSQPLGITESAIAWEAHVGGFLVGFLGFALFDPAQNRRAPASL